MWRGARREMGQVVTTLLTGSTAQPPTACTHLEGLPLDDEEILPIFTGSLEPLHLLAVLRKLT